MMQRASGVGCRKQHPTLHHDGACSNACLLRFHTPSMQSSLRFDYAGNMDSGGAFRFGGFMKEVEQVAAAKVFLESQHNKQVVLLLGHSRGAINATLYAGHHGDIPMVVLVAGRYDLTLNMTQRYGPDVLQQLQRSGPRQQVTKRDGDRHPIHWQLTAEEMQERFSLDVAGACTRISSRQPRPSVLVLHGCTDPICEAADAVQLAHSIAGSQLMEVEGADHWFAGRQQQLLHAVEAYLVHAWKH
ncbi:Alpha/Beta hydrolase protein [Scenedesmus sp. NREL 46B-D3]|nr:Alpha/Beta hydrolase protein [Scenedesmus sp. NREL 46B-D3]